MLREGEREVLLIPSQKESSVFGGCFAQTLIGVGGEGQRLYCTRARTLRPTKKRDRVRPLKERMGWGEGIGGKKIRRTNIFSCRVARGGFGGDNRQRLGMTNSAATRQCSSGSEAHGETKRDDDDETTDRAKTRKGRMKKTDYDDDGGGVECGDDDDDWKRQTKAHAWRRRQRRGSHNR
jgi:hypothetical protein